MAIANDQYRPKRPTAKEAVAKQETTGKAELGDSCRRGRLRVGLRSTGFAVPPSSTVEETPPVLREHFVIGFRFEDCRSTSIENRMRRLMQPKCNLADGVDSSFRYRKLLFVTMHRGE
jgi:hypothetical protein